MSDEHECSNGFDEDAEAHGLDPDAIDPGEPLMEIVALRVDPDAAFLRRLRERILRRLAVAHTADLALQVFARTLTEYVSMIMEFFAGESRPGRRKEEDENG